jgi:DNA polymerase III gamma/tau subunit
MHDSGKDAKVFLSDLLDYLQDLITARITGFDSLTMKRDSEMIELMKEQSKRISPKKIIELSTVLVETLAKLRNFKEPYFPILLVSLNFITDEGSSVPQPSQKEIEPVIEAQSKVIQEQPNPQGDTTKKESVVVAEQTELTIEKVMSSWDKVLAAIKPKSISLFAMVTRATPVEYKDKTLTLIPEKKFYVSMLRQESNLNFIEQALQQVFGTAISVSISEPKDEKLFNKEETIREVVEKPVVKEVLDLFDASVTDVNKIEEEK